MKHLLVAAAAFGLLAGCQQPNSAATGLMASYTLAATGVASYAAQPGSDPRKVKALRACEDATWAEVKPVSDALIAKQSPTDAALANATDGVAKLNTCLTSFGAK